MSANIHVIVQPRDFPSQDDYQFIIPLGEEWVREYDAPIKECDEPILRAIVGTSKVTEMEIRTKRKHSAHKLEGVILKHLIEFFERNDTVNGYPKDR